MAKRYQQQYQYRPGLNPYRYAEGMAPPAAPQLSPPPGAPNLRRPSFTPAEARMKGETQMYSSLSDMLSNWTDRFARQATEQAKLRGKKEGLAAALGETDAPELTGEFTAYGQAYDEGALLAHQAAVQNDIRTTVGRLELENPSDPTVFGEKVEAYREGLMNEVSPDLRPWAHEEINTYASRSQLQVESRFNQEKKRSETSEISNAADGLFDDVLEAARNGDSEHQLDKRDELELLLQKAVETGHYDTADVDKVLADLDDKTLKQSALGAFQKIIMTEGVEEAEEVYRNYQAADLQLPPVLHEQMLSGMSVMLGRERAAENRERAKTNAETSARNKQAKIAVDDAVDALTRGFMPNDLEQTIADAADTPHERKLIEGIAGYKTAQAFRSVPFPQQATELDRLRDKFQDEGASGPQAKLLERMETIHNEIQAALTSGDGLSQAVKDGVIDELLPLDYTNNESFAWALHRRKQQAQQAEAHYRQDISALTPEEVALFKERLADLEPDSKVVMLATMVESLGEESIPVLGELVDKGAPVLGMAGDLIRQGQPQQGLAREALLGLPLINAAFMPPKEQLERAIWAELGDAFQADLDGAHTQAIIETVSAIYARRSYLGLEGSDLSPSGTIAPDTDRVKKIVAGVLGGELITRDNNNPLTKDVDPKYSLPPIPGLPTKDTLEDFVDNLTARDINLMGGLALIDGEDITEDFLKFLENGTSRLRYFEHPEKGAGYHVVGTHGLLYQDAWGEPFLLQHKKAEPRQVVDPEVIHGVEHRKRKGASDAPPSDTVIEIRPQINPRARPPQDTEVKEEAGEKMESKPRRQKNPRARPQKDLSDAGALDDERQMAMHNRPIFFDPAEVGDPKGWKTWIENEQVSDQVRSWRRTGIDDELIMEWLIDIFEKQHSPYLLDDEWERLRFGEAAGPARRLA